MARLTEEMVIARTRASDLSTIKKLNCWGGELQDVSLLRRLTGVEVLSLSVNKISTLADIQHCKNLKELYVRRNNIKNLNEICYLKNLPHLRALWLGENPCSIPDTTYRLTVIKNLPYLEKLDDVKIEPEERQDATRRGKILTHPEESDRIEEAEENYFPAPSAIVKSPSVGHRLSERNVQEPEAVNRTEDRKENYPHARYYEEPERYNQPRGTEAYCEPISHDNAANKTNPGSGEEVQTDHPPTSSDPRESDLRVVERPLKKEEEANTNKSEDEYCNCPNHYYERSEVSNVCSERRRSSAGSDLGSPHKRSSEEDRYLRYQYEKTYQGDNDNDYQKTEEDLRNNKPAYYLPRKPVNRNSNLLSAVLCLIKELDYRSLEVVGIAVKCRMDELEE